MHSSYKPYTINGSELPYSIASAFNFKVRLFGSLQKTKTAKVACNERDLRFLLASLELIEYSYQ